MQIPIKTPRFPISSLSSLFSFPLNVLTLKIKRGCHHYICSNNFFHSLFIKLFTVFTCFTMSLNVASRSSSSSTRSSSYSTPPSSFSSTRPSPSYSYSYSYSSSSSSSSSSSFPPRCVSRLTSSSLSSPSPCSDVWLDLAQELSSTSAKISSTPALAPARVIYGADPDFQEVLDRAQCVIRRAKVVLLHRKIQKLHAEINLPRARPSQTGSQVKQRFTFDHRGPAVPAATQGSTRKSFHLSNVFKAVH